MNKQFITVIIVFIVTTVSAVGEQQTAIKWNNKAWILYNQSIYNDAINAFDKAILLNPNIARAWNGKGLVLDKQGDYNEAIKAFDEATKLNPNLTEAWNGKGWTFYNIGRYDDAIKAFDNATQLNRNLTDAWNGKDRAQKGLLKQHNESIDASDKSIQLKPKR